MHRRHIGNGEQRMQVGDLVKFRQNGVLGLIVGGATDGFSLMFRVQWFDDACPVQSRYAEEMEVVSESR